MLEVRYSGTPEPAAGADHPQRLQHHRLDHHRRTARSGRCRSRTAPTPGTRSTTSPPTRRSTTSPSPSPSPWVGIANGELVDQTEQDGLTTTSWHLSSPASSYLVTVAIGDYTRTSNTSASGVEIDYWVPERPARARRRAGVRRHRAGLAGGAARPVPVRQPRLPARRLAQRHGDPDDDHAGRRPTTRPRRRCWSTRWRTSGTATRSRPTTGATSG